MAFDDRAPAAVRHILVIPRQHIPNTNSLSGNDAALGACLGANAGRCFFLHVSVCPSWPSSPPLSHVLEASALTPGQLQTLHPAPGFGAVRHMRAVGQQLLKASLAPLAHGAAADTFKFGFHKPPLRSVDHLQ